MQKKTVIKRASHAQEEGQMGSARSSSYDPPLDAERRNVRCRHNTTFVDSGAFPDIKRQCFFYTDTLAQQSVATQVDLSKALYTQGIASHMPIGEAHMLDAHTWSLSWTRPQGVVAKLVDTASWYDLGAVTARLHSFLDEYAFLPSDLPYYNRDYYQDRCAHLSALPGDLRSKIEQCVQIACETLFDPFSLDDDVGAVYGGIQPRQVRSTNVALTLSELFELGFGHRTLDIVSLLADAPSTNCIKALLHGYNSTRPLHTSLRSLLSQLFLQQVDQAIDLLRRAETSEDGTHALRTIAAGWCTQLLRGKLFALRGLDDTFLSQYGMPGF